MKISEIKKLSRDELNNKVNTLKKDLFNLRFRKVNGPIDDPAKISEIKNVDFETICKYTTINALNFFNLDE